MHHNELIIQLNGIQEAKKYLTQLSIMRQYSFQINGVLYTCADLRKAIEEYDLNDQT